MFTGIIQKTVPITATSTVGKNVRLSVSKPAGWKLTKGQSIAVDGVCLTVISQTSRTFTADAMPETLKKTTVGSFTPGRIVNLERALKLSDLLDGHLIQGHVDSRAEVVSVVSHGTSKLITIRVPASLLKKIALHGSVAVNGTSLTVAKRVGNNISVALIPYTLAHTNLGTLKKGDLVNLETDFLARHLTSGNRAKVKSNATRRIPKSTRN
ncbi:MAG TPA: riboflavin synthase [Candidatus Paceibacterota bacterium]|nr:riboflavin synthase [Candidatus Paceibacterota bacterium]